MGALFSTQQSPLVHKFVVDVLKRSPFMQLLDDPLIADIARCFEVVKYARGAVIKTDSHQFFIVAEGAVDISSLIPVGLSSAATATPTKSKQQVSELLCQRTAGDYICYTSHEQLLTRLLLASGDGNSLLSTKKKLMKLLDLNKTSADTAVGCTLIRLQREKFLALRQRVGVRRSNVKNTARFSGGKGGDRGGNALTGAEKIHLVKSIVESEIVSYLIDIPFLENVEESRLVTLSNLCSYMFVRRGHVLCQEGEVGDRFFICIRGSLQATVNVHMNSASQTFVTIATTEKRPASPGSATTADPARYFSTRTPMERKIQALKRMATGSYFGEISLLYKIPRIASVTATEDSLLVSIDRATFCNFLKMVPEASLVLLEHVRMHFLDNLIKQGCAFLNAIPPLKLQELSAISELAEHQTGATIIRKDEKRAAFYILLRGEVEMLYEDEDHAPEAPASKQRRSELVLVRPGGYFGQEALILRRGSPVRVRCTDHCLTLTLSPDAFAAFFATLPEVYSEFCIKCLRDMARPEHVMQHFDARKLWAADCVGRRRHHDVALFEYVEDFKWEADVSDERIHERALVIYMRFLAESAPCPVSISVKAAHAIEQQLCAQTVGRDLFAGARDEILAGMEDAHFAAFKRSRAFAEFLASLHCPQTIYDALSPEQEARLSMSCKHGRGFVRDLDDDGPDDDDDPESEAEQAELAKRPASAEHGLRRNSPTVFSVAHSLAASAVSGRYGTTRDFTMLASDRSESISVGGSSAATKRHNARASNGQRRISASFVY